jgi:hypothetical protein
MMDFSSYNMLHAKAVCDFQIPSPHTDMQK